MRSRPIVFFCMPDWSHFQRVSLVVADLVRAGAPVFVFTHERFRAVVERAGAEFVDLFSSFPLEVADDESWPVHLRYVSFAGAYAGAIHDRVKPIGPALIVHDTFAVIGGVVARLAGVPHVNVCAGHNFAPEPFLAVLRSHPRLRISTRCLEAVDALRTRYGMADASPFLYVTGFSPFLNLYCEPPEFLMPEERRVFEPIAFYGSLSADLVARPPSAEPLFGADVGDRLKIYLAFGTIPWTARAEEATAALDGLTRGLHADPRTRAMIGLGGADVRAEVRARWASDNVSIETFANQWDVLAQADVFLTHHGMKSTHEAIFHGVPMISYPFFGDQPVLARFCQRRRLAVPLVETVMGAVGPDDLRRALALVRDDAAGMRAALAEAREWEIAVIRNRPAVIDQILDLRI